MNLCCMETAVHIGELIQRRLKDLGMSKTELARRINLRSQSIIPMLKKPSINTAQLEQIGQALNYDFFQHYTTSSSATVSDGSNSRMHTGRAGVSIMINIDDEAKQEKVLRLLGISLK